MTRPAVVYVDMPWALDANGRVDCARATIEHSVLGDAFELRFVPAQAGKYPLAGPALNDAVAGAAALVISRCVITDELLDAAGTGLRAVCRQGVGYDNLAPALLEARGVIGFNVPDYCIDEVAAHTVALALALERRLIPQHTGLAGGRFDIYAGGIPRRLRNHVAGIVGFGRIGRVVGARLADFYGRVIACDPYVNADVMAAHGATRVELDELLGTADLISLHCLLHDQTYHLLDARAFARMKPTTYLVNAARGAIVEARALCETLRESRLAGAGLDVFDPEDPDQDPWWREVVASPSVVVTSHRAFLSAESSVSQRTRASEGLRHVLTTGRPPASGYVTSATHPALTKAG
jgi:phosphoglycerate dehydrogenase-like enzyme